MIPISMKTVLLLCALLGLIVTVNAESRDENRQLDAAIARILQLEENQKIQASEIRELKCQNKDLIAALDDRESGYCFFSVGTNKEETYEEGETMRFHYVDANIKPASLAGGWDEASNTFTCPISGHYLFMFSLHKGAAERLQEVRFSLMVGSSNKAAIYNYWEGTDSSAHTSHIHVIVPCSAGQQVKLENTNSGIVADSDAARYTHFSGMLLKHGL